MGGNDGRNLRRRSQNVKLTTPEDFLRAENANLSDLGDIRTGFGTDVHQFTTGDHIWLGGVKIPHSRGVTGHSDADVVLHSLVDAILGAISDGDIGVHFPPSDPQWKGASSDRFLAFAVERVRGRGGLIAHLDITVVCEAPRVGPHRDAMRARIAEIAGVSAERVAIKATTSEKMGFTGRGEGIVAFATATVRLPWKIDRRCAMATLIEQATALLELCRRKKLRIATAESCTGGLIAATLTEVPGSSDVVERGFVTYSNEAKQAMLGVPAATIEKFGAVSRETAEAMAAGAWRIPRPSSQFRSRELPAPAAAHPRSPSGSSILPPPRRAAI